MVDASDSLIIIEAPGKKARLSKILSELGFYGYYIIATKGRLYDIPKEQCLFDFNDLASSLSEPLFPEIPALIIEKAKRYKQAIIMTDNDAEGELIAYHAYSLLPEEMRVHRGLFNSLKKTEIARSIKNLRNYEKSPLVDSKIAERILDRIIGYKKSNLLPSSSLGRVLSPALKAIDDTFDSALTAEASPRPEFYSFVTYVSQKEVVEPRHVVNAMQSLYEKGLISYPRTISCEFSDETINELKYHSYLMSKQSRSHQAKSQGGLTTEVTHEGLHVTEVLDSVFSQGPQNLEEKVYFEVANVSTNSLTGNQLPAPDVEKILKKPDVAKEIKLFQILRDRKLGSPSSSIMHCEKINKAYMEEKGLSSKGINSIRLAMETAPLLLNEGALSRAKEHLSNTSLSIEEKLIASLEALNISTKDNVRLEYHSTKPAEDELTLS